MKKLMVFAFCALTLNACSGKKATDWTKAADTADNIVKAAVLEVPLVQAAFPSLLSPTQAAKLTNADGSGLLDLAKKDVALLKADIATGASSTKNAATIAEIEGYVNQAIAATGPVLSVVCASNDAKCVNAQTAYRSLVLAVPLLEIFLSNAGA